jgi:hypothetical protein
MVHPGEIGTAWPSIDEQVANAASIPDLTPESAAAIEAVLRAAHRRLTKENPMTTTDLTDPHLGPEQPDITAPAAVEVAPFDSLPSGLDIAHWFIDQGDRFHNRHGAGNLLWQGDDASLYGTIWKVAEVDQDSQQFYLLSIGEHDEHEDSATYDLLFVTAGVLTDGVKCEWRNEATPFITNDDLAWFLTIIDAYEDTWA